MPKTNHKKTVLITGASGIIGSFLKNKLIARGYNVTSLSRNEKRKNSKTYRWDISQGYVEDGAIESANYIIHLAGANISKNRWTSKRKKIIIDSRVKSTQLLFKKVLESKIELNAFISSSAIGYYGTYTSNKILKESNSSGKDFLGNTCLQWEKEIIKFKDIGIRTVILRTGVVLTTKGAALPKMMSPINSWLGMVLGSGKQYIPWIHIDDICNIYIEAIENEKFRGIYNGVAPEHVNNSTFTKTLASILKKPVWSIKLPEFIFKLLYGEMAVIFLKGSRISSEKLIKIGYKFQFKTLKNALIDLLRK